jgi:hypothetical protein
MGNTLMTRFGSFALKGLKLFGNRSANYLSSRYRIDQDWHISSSSMAWVVLVDVSSALGGFSPVHG